MTDADTNKPLFDSTRAALVFALNAHQPEMPRPFMNKAMAENVKLKRRRNDVEMVSEEEPRKCSGGPRRESLRGLDKAAQAGMILQHFARLEHPEQLVLSGLLLQAYEPCYCQRPCCSGLVANARWRKVTHAMCLVLQETGDVLRVPGKKGLSTPPILRMAFVEQYFTKNSRTLTEMASRAQVTMVTAAKHRDWICSYLGQTEQTAWLAIQEIFDQAGITGALE